MRRWIAGWIVVGLTLAGAAQAGGAGQVVVSQFEDGTTQLYTVSLDGSDLARLDLGVDDLYSGSISAAPDGRYLAVSRRVSGDDGKNWVDLYLYDHATGTLTAVNTDPAPVSMLDYSAEIEDWSPDGTRLLYDLGGFDNDINLYTSLWEYNLADGKTRLLISHSAPDGYGIEFASYAPDGLQIVFSAGDGLHTGDPADSRVDNIYVMEGDGANLRRLTSSGSRNFAPHWSPDGTQIAFTSSRSDNYDLFVMNADGSGQTQLTLNPADDYDGRWTPDGTALIFLSNRSRPTSFGFDALYDLYALPVGGSSATRLTRTGNLWGFEVLPAGMVAYYTSATVDVQAGLYVVSAGGGDPIPLLDDLPVNHHVTALTWRSDS